MATAAEIQAQIEAVHAEIDGRLEQALTARDRANEEVKMIRAEKDAAPRLHVKRNTKKKVADVEFINEPTASDRAPTRLPGALEMFPNGIERTEKAGA